jgi:hypothetical protein
VDAPVTDLNTPALSVALVATAKLAPQEGNG